LGTERRYCQDRTLPWQEVRSQAVIVVPSQSEVHVLDEVGTFLWAELLRPRSSEELARRVCEEFDVAPERAGRDVSAFLESLLEKRLLISD
jgi:hypothetical protein